jgi:glycerophosphoryl diester phosphodiesterase
MKKTMHLLLNNLTYNFKTLLMFVLLYRVFGILVIFPITRFLFMFSIRLTGVPYVNNRMLLEYLFKPTTILILLLLLIIYTIYFAIELIFLAILYDVGYHEEKINLKSLIQYGSKRILPTFKKYHIALIIPSLFFVVIVELGHIVGIASTMTIPPFVLEQIKMLDYIEFFVYGMLLIMFILLIESSLTLFSYVVDQHTIRFTYQKNRKLIKQKRIKHILEFIGLNAILNGLLYLVYTLILLVMGLLIFITRGQEFVLGFLLTMLYTLYTVFVFISSLILIPINFALFSSWYYEGKESLGVKINWLKFAKIIRQPFESKRMKRALFFTLFAVFMLNITTVFATVTQPFEQIELFNYAQIVAHRGASKDAPENTISAIELAILQGADAVEFDVRLSRDLVPILMHDTTLRRTTGDPRRVDEVTFEQLRTLDAGGWFSPEFEGEQIPTLDEALSVIKGRANAFVELKVNNVVLERQTVELIESYNMVHDVVILSFYREQLGRIKALNPDINTLLLMTSFIGNEEAVLSYPEVDIFGFERSFIITRPDLIAKIHERDKKIFVWTLSTSAHIESAVLHDFDGLITSLPVLARELEYAKNRQVEFIEILRSLFKRNG